MPFEAIPPSDLPDPAHKPRVAVIGGGISGLGAAHYLADRFAVTLYEAGPRLGGHARTVVAGKAKDQPVDTGFIVFNYANYPKLAALFAELDVPVVKSNMSFGASIDGGRLEYALTNLNAMFAQRSNAVNPQFWRMIRDILRFNAQAEAQASDPGITLRELLDRLGTGRWFRDYYLLPMSGAIWSTPTEKIMDFPAHAMVSFFKNHALLSATGQHQWYTVKGGSVQYVARLEASLRERGVQIKLGHPIDGVRRTAGRALVRAAGQPAAQFDHVVFALHSDDAMALLEDARPHERSALGAIAYQPNDIVLHADQSIMPRRRKTWASWVYTEDQNARSERIDLTYWMNSLQPIPKSDPMFVTLNTRRQIRDDLIYDQVTLRHPVFDLGALAAQQRIRAFNGADNTWFCGAWMRHGFHEDGLHSAFEVAQRLGAAQAWPVAAE